MAPDSGRYQWIAAKKGGCIEGGGGGQCSQMSCNAGRGDRFATILYVAKANRIKDLSIWRGSVSTISGISSGGFSNFFIGNDEDFDRIGFRNCMPQVMCLVEVCKPA